jgi:predicted NAD-dependent protein-ADP-ribosyltransferase YbiA (DUF1768 family)
MERVCGFTGKYSFLDNEYQTPVYYQGLIYPSVAHAFQAARTPHEDTREKIAKTLELPALYALTSHIQDPPDWSRRRETVMEMLLRDKIRRNRDIQGRLGDTADAPLVNAYAAASSPTDTLWGMIDGRGHNKVGKMLEAIRQDLISGREVDEWLHCSFDLVSSRDDLPTILLHCFRDSEELALIEVRRKSYVVLGARGDIVLRHPSVSRQHAALLVDSELGPSVVDLGSKHGTWLGTSKLRVGIAAPLQSGDRLRFGCSSKEYQVEVDYADVTRLIERKKRQLDAELRKLDELTKED